MCGHDPFYVTMQKLCGHFHVCQLTKMLMAFVNYMFDR